VAAPQYFTDDPPEDFRVYAYDINTNTRIDEIQAFNLSFGRRLNGTGPCLFEMFVDTTETSAAAQEIVALGGNPFAAYVELNGVLQWGGPVWTTSYQKSRGTLQLGGNDWFSYLDQRTQAKGYDTGAAYTPPAFIQQVIADMQDPSQNPGASIGLQVASILDTSQPTMVPNYPASQRTTVAQMITDMTQIMLPTVGGVDFTLSTTWSGGTTGFPVNTLTIWTPRAGRQASQSSFLLDLDNVIDFTWPTDASKMGTSITLTGGGTGSAMLSETMQSGAPVGGLGQLPRLDKVVNFPGVQSVQQLSAMNAGVAEQYGSPLITPTVTIPTAGALGEFAIGDDLRVKASAGDPMFPQGYDDYWQVVAIDVTVPNDGIPEMTLTLNVPPAY
jgi:hypothetical protein